MSRRVLELELLERVEAECLPDVTELENERAMLQVAEFTVTLRGVLTPLAERCRANEEKRQHARYLGITRRDESR